MTETPKPGPRPKPKTPIQRKSDPEAFVKMAKQAVLDNYNSMRDETKAPELTFDDLFIVKYARILQNWTVVITSPIARRLEWEVTFNNYRNELYVNTHQKIYSGKVSLGEKVPS